MTRTLIVGTRGSALALAQARAVASALRLAGISCREQVIETDGDRLPDVIAGDGVFVKQIQQHLLDGLVDVAVHSLKDVPTQPVDGLAQVAVPARADAREALVGSTLDGLPPGARVGTSSPRRAAQLRAERNDLMPVAIRGNVPTRIAKARTPDYDAVLLACAGLERLGLTDRADEIFPLDRFLPAPGQGALLVEMRAGDPQRGVAQTLDDAATRIAVESERAVLRALGGGCMLPVAAIGTVNGDTLTLRARVVAPDGSRDVRVREHGPVQDAVALAASVALDLERRGAMELIDA